MIGHPGNPRTFADDLDPHQLNVFIPGAIAGGFLVSLALLVGDAVRKLTGGTGADREVEMTSAALADEVRMGTGAAAQAGRGLRPRAAYGIAGGVALGIGLGALPGSTWNFFNPSGYARDVGWAWALSLVAIVGLLYVGAQLMRLAPEWWPIFFLVTGSATVLRFVFGGEAFEIRASVIAATAVVMVIGIAATWRFRHRRGSTNVPPSTRRLLAKTPAGKID